MAGQGQILKYCIGIVMAVLLTHECVVETLDFPETSIDLELSYIDGQLRHRIPRSADSELLEFIVVIEVNASQAVVIEQIRASLASITFPLQLDNSTEVTAANITTVCQPNESEYQCVCEDGYAWSYNNCQTYVPCGDIRFGSCGCINGVPSDGEMCVLESELPFTDFLFEIELESTSISVIDEMRRFLQNINLPLQLDEVVEVLDVDITTVCNFNDSGYKCVCEDQYLWPCEKCKEYGSCDGITNNTCSCINDIPSDRQFCQTVSEITNCGQQPSVPVEYLTEIQIDAENPAIIDLLRQRLMFFSLPYTVSDSTNITKINITTVCSLNETQYQCKCEGLFVWPNDTCHSYEACDDITDGSCTCINALPIDGQFCQLKEVQPSDYVIDLDVRFFDLFLISYLRNLFTNISLPLTLSNSINITDIDVTTVCGLNGTEYECNCEQNHVWPSDTCRAYQVCDSIVGGNCGCIQALPSEGPLCQRDINECKDAVSVCGQYSDCINIIGSHMCSCWSGFNTFNKDSPVNRNNSCQDIDECLFSPSVCGPNSICTNQLGSYNCSCLDGFTATVSSFPISNDNTCTDVHECLNTLEVCGPNSYCTNSIGGYNCSCLSGFTVTNSSEPVSTSNPCNVTLPLTEYLIEIQINSMDSSITDQLRNLLMFFSLPYTISDSTNITEINITTVCSLNETQYQCKCEGLFVWPNDTCHSYEACDVITDGSCTCINVLPIDGQFCQVLPSNYVIDIDVRFFDSFLVDYLRNIVRNINLPLTLRNSINITDIDMTTVCGLNGTEYKCNCEQNHVWPSDTCRAYQVCDSIVGGTCGCIQALPSEGSLCQRDINECKDAVSVCGQYSDCINIIGSHMCSCWSGFNTSNKDSPVSHNNSCQDIDECLFSPSVCGPNSICTNQLGSYNCSCLDGFTATVSSFPISNDNTCTDVHECLNTLEVCGPNSYCTNSIGGYNCSCLSGFTVTNSSEPVSTSNPCNVTLPLTEYLIEIQINSMDSSITDQLRNLLMFFSLPYTISDSTNITEINITTVCSLNETQYQCKCEGLFVWPNDTCHSYEACDDITDGSCTCINALPIDGQFCQVLPSNYLIDIDVRFFDSFLVDYLRNIVRNINLPLTLRNSINITDIDMTTVCGLNGTEYECNCEQNHVWPSDTCRAYQVCDSIVGGTCGCIQALPSEGSLCQRDINECLFSPSVCGPNANCTNEKGSYSCSCLDGFTATIIHLSISINNKCRDVDECVEIPDVCGPNSICNNTVGSHNCSCMSGYNVTDPDLPINSSNICTDINECLFSPSVCGPNANCTNEKGSYNCSCLDGFTETNLSFPISNDNTCRDVDECVEIPDICGPNSICNNTVGSHNCSCMSGYNITDPNLPINSNNTCEDINECLFSPSVCGPNANCTNEKGSYNCSCLDGFTASNSSLSISNDNTCSDVDECVEIPDICGPNSICNNTVGSHNCSCMSGYNVTDPNLPINSNNTCEDINECLFSPSVCGPNANCTNEKGSYNCSCLDGFTSTNSSLPISNDNTCRDVDECLFSSSVCGPNSICMNEIGSFNCSCLYGFTVTNSSLPISTDNSCRDVDECDEKSDICGPNSICNNTVGSHNCSCMSGYNVTDPNLPINSSNTCEDIDECLLSPSVCGPNANCTNEKGSYNCSCLNGFTATNSSLSISINNTCRDVDECETPDICGPNSICYNTVGSYNCSCMSGYNVTDPNLPINSNNTCKDIYECLDSVSVCGLNSYCYNYNGSFSCFCWEGYNASDVNKEVSKSNPCIDINECLFSPSVCGPNANCTNEIGSYNCSCLDGFTATNSSLSISINNTCRDVDECVEISDVCGPNSICNNTVGSHNCSCMNGYNVTDPNFPINSYNPCKDIYECLDSVSVCGPNSYCYNYNGSFSCFCWDGYNVSDGNTTIREDNPCTDINECLLSPSVCGPNANCTNEKGSYNCSCLDGFTATNSSLTISINNKCTDVDECVEIPDVCGPNSICNNTVGSHNCSCMNGYNVTDPNLPINSNNTCEDINECLFSPSVCGPNSNCTNEKGSYNCSCLDGFTATNSSLTISIKNQCRDVDECFEIPDICGPNSICNNTVGSHNCSCMSGYNVTDPNLPINHSNICKDVNECVEIPDICGPNSICNNTVGSHNCSCMSGYNVTDPNLPINSNNTCKDIDECLFSPSVCGPNANCTNEKGSYNCSCLDGFTETNSSLKISINNTCRDVDECVEISNICGPNSICNNTVGSHNCSCMSGYNVTDPNLPINSSNICKDIIECLFSPSVCGPNANCTNEKGSYNCSCLDGFTATNSSLSISINNTCRDVDECVEIPDICGPNSICNNTVGSHNCSCKSGYNVTDPNLPINSSNTCKDVNECVEIPDICGPNSICNNTVGSHNCSCMSGYNVTDPNLPINSNNTCEDIIECLFSPSVCGPNANCTNEKGSYNCSCLDGFTATNSSLSISIKNLCRDVDECFEIPDICGPNSICNNTVGSHNCSCMSGYNVTDPNLPINSSNICKDVDECVEIPDICGPNSICNNTVGSHNCSCKSGYNVTDPNLPINSNNTCKDIIECLFSASVCGPNANCTNEKGSYNCSCLDGFTASNSSLPISNNNTCTAEPPTPTTTTTTAATPNATIITSATPNTTIITSATPNATNTTSAAPNTTIITAATPNTTNTTSATPTTTNTTAATPNTTNTTSAAPNTTSITAATPNTTDTTSAAPNTTNTTSAAPNTTIITAATPNTTNTTSAAPNTTSITAATPNTTNTSSATPNTTSITVATPNATSITAATPNATIITAATPTTTTTTAATPTTTTTTAATPTTTPKTTVLLISMKIDAVFDTSLNNQNNEKFKILARQIESAIEQIYKNVLAYKKGSIKVFRFRPGSIIADYQIESTDSSPNSPAFAEANTQLISVLKDQGITVAPNAFAQSEQKNLSTAKNWYPEQNMVLKCERLDSGTMRWTVNDQDPAQNKVKYVISDDSTTLTVNNVNENDKARYACIIDRTIPYIQWQDIVIETLPNIIVGENVRKFQCVDQTVSLKCCEEKYSVEWTQITSDDVVTSEDKCITLRHTIKTGNCGSKTFTCRLKDPVLQGFTYSSKSVIVNKVNAVFSCKDATFGDGQEGDTLTGPCEKGKEGTIKYRCSSGRWVPQETNCILQVIKGLEKDAAVLVVQDIPEFVAQLSTATENNTQVITQSAVTVQTIVGILVKVSGVSQNIIINQPVMEDFLKTVDIIVSTSAIETWKNLNNNNKTDNTSTALLKAIEDISNRLTNANFRINATSIELNRTITNTTFYSGISNLPNSTTEIQIPEISLSTAITIIVFTTLDSILPTRDTRSNGSSKSDMRINGDVVVVKVDNKTINNISFAFDITNKSLGNPQCVFWNFYLDAWDSTGCKSKSYKSEGNRTGKITCECNHTTSFSILMSPFSIDNIALAYITYIGVAISMASLIICLIIETIVWRSMTRNDTSYMRHVSIVNIAVSLLIANVCFIIGAAVAESEQPTSVGRCSPVVFFMHFFYLALFFWMLMSALLLFYRTVMVLSQMSRAKMMAIAFIVGYGAPLLIAAITVASTAGPQNYVSKRNACWLNWLESKALLAFVVPALTIVAINLLVLIVVLYKMLRRGVGATTQPDEKHALVVIARCVAILTPIFGLTWGFGIGTMVSQELGIHVVFALLNSLQGFFILVFGTLLDSKIREALAGRLSLRNLTSSNRTRSTSAGPSSSGIQSLFQRMRRRNVYNVSEAFSAATSSHNSSGTDTFVNA
ncbi:fibrillin-1 isoform X12 [Carassius gibelio]|uniref:fibrillin-1 isoform X12 n=1 Tax=Carassius gibelio TaxID=101364 RepID=UPI00227898B2|nr:fibrillin-1 isoform X12 [Carassius gibelio]